MGTTSSGLAVHTVELATMSDIVAIILAIVALAITIVGFFASLKFYRDGVELQQSAERALLKLEEKTNSIQAHVSGMFEKTLDAAIAKSQQLDEGFEPIVRQVEQASQDIARKLIQELGKVGEKEKKNIEKHVSEQLDLIKRKVDEARASAENLVVDNFDRMPKSDLQVKILKHLSNSPEPISVPELAKRMNMSEAAIDRAMSRLYSRKLIQATGEVDKEKNYVFSLRTGD